MWPLLPRIKAAAEFGLKIENDPGVKEAMATAMKYIDDPEAKAAIQTVIDVIAAINKAEQTSTASGPGGQAGGGIGSDATA